MKTKDAPPERQGSEARVGRRSLWSEWQFEARQYHPPADPVNALLSLAYTLLYHDLYGAVNVVGLDPYLGFYHQPKHGHAALSSDLMEEFRSPVVDRLVLTLLNKRVLGPQDFERSEEGRLRLRPEALKRFFGCYAQTIQSRTWYPYAGNTMSWRQVMELQVRQCARVLAGEEPAYRPFDAEAALSREQE